MRADLVAAMKARQPETVAALRTAIAALDNAAAVEVLETAPEDGSAHVAGARAGVGATEAQRRALPFDEVRTLLRQQVDERVTEAERWKSHGRDDAAGRLGREAAALRPASAPRIRNQREPESHDGRYQGRIPVA